MASHLSTSRVDHGVWPFPLVGGVPSRTWSIIASVGVTIWALAAVLLVAINFAAPRLNDVRTGSPIAIIAAASFVVGAIATLTGFPLTYRQADRERLAGYTTMRWRSYRWLPVVNPRTLVIEHGQFTMWDVAAARARTPWASAASNQPTTPTTRFVRRPTRWSSTSCLAGAASVVLAVSASQARVASGSVSESENLFIGATVMGALVAAVLASALAFRAVQAKRLAIVSGLANGITVACYATPELRASSDRLGVDKRAIPAVPVLAFDQEGFTIWSASGVPTPVARFDRRDVLDIGSLTTYSGWARTPGLEISVVPADERWPFLMTFTVFDPTRMLIAANDEKNQALANAVTELWTGRPI